MLVAANTSLTIARPRGDADRVCAPASPGFVAFAAYLRLMATTSAASASRNAARSRGGAGDANAVRSRANGDETSGMAALPCGREEEDGETVAEGFGRGQPGL